MLASRPALNDTHAQYHPISTSFSIQNPMYVLEPRTRTILKLMHQFWQPLLCGLAVVVESGRGP